MKTAKVILLCAVLTAALSAKANIIVGFEPAAQSINGGGLASLDLVVSGLGGAAGPALGAFDFDLGFNSGILSLNSLAFGNHLDLGIAGSIQSFTVGAGTIHLDEVSLESPGDLLANQPTSFTLATLTFSGVAPGTGTVGVNFGSLSDETGLLSLPFSTQSADIEVIGGVSVPDTSRTAALLLVACAGLVGSRRFICA